MQTSRKVNCSNDNLVLFSLIILPAIFDSINGYLQIQLGINSPIGILFRFSIIVYLLIKTINYRRLALLCFASIWILGITFYWNLAFRSNLIEEILNFVYYFYFILYFNFFKKAKYSPEIILKYITNYGFLISIIIILCFLLGIGNKSYGEDYGFGTKGFFIAGNDLGLTLIFALAGAFLYRILYVQNIYYSILPYVIVIGCFLVGSRVCMILSVLELVCFSLYILLFLPVANNKLFKILQVIFICTIALILFNLFKTFDAYTLERLSFDSMGSARDGFVSAAKDHIESFNFLSCIIGNGSENLFDKIGRQLMLGESKSVEADFYETIGSYGYVLGIIIYSIFIIPFIKSIYIFFKKKNIITLTVLLLNLLFIVIGFLAGHAMRNSMVAPLYAAFNYCIEIHNQTHINNNLK